MTWSVSTDVSNRLAGEETDGFIGEDVFDLAIEAITGKFVTITCELETGRDPGIEDCLRPNWYFNFKGGDGNKIADWFWNSEFGYRAAFESAPTNGLNINRLFIIGVGNALVSEWTKSGDDGLTPQQVKSALMLDERGALLAFEPKLWTILSPPFGFAPEITSTNWLNTAQEIVQAWKTQYKTQYPSNPTRGEIKELLNATGMNPKMIKSLQGIHAPTGAEINQAQFVIRAAWLDPNNGYKIVPGPKRPHTRASGLHDYGWT
ncbi:MAG: hypothetical protein ACI9CO_000052 [Candidatus Azotimanducaceae bacterium]|jgi:hypothetical protein